MKKTIGVLLIICILFMAGCKKNEPAIVITKNMLSYSNNDKNFQAVRGRYEAVLEVLKNEVTLLEQAHNEEIKIANPENYFLLDDYILTVFDPFAVTEFDLTESFDEQLDLASAKLVYEAQAGGREVMYEYEDRVFTLKFMQEGSTDIYTAECGKDYDSFSFRHSVISSGGETVIEFLDFTAVGENTYAIESSKHRCYISFAADSTPDYIRFSSLSDGINDSENSLFSSPVPPGKNWVTRSKNASYNSIVEFENGVLTHSDSSTGKLKEYKINESDYNSVFL